MGIKCGIGGAGLALGEGGWGALGGEGLGEALSGDCGPRLRSSLFVPHRPPGPLRARSEGPGRR